MKELVAVKNYKGDTEGVTEDMLTKAATIMFKTIKEIPDLSLSQLQQWWNYYWPTEERKLHYFKRIGNLVDMSGQMVDITYDGYVDRWYHAPMVTELPPIIDLTDDNDTPMVIDLTEDT